MMLRKIYTVIIFLSGCLLFSSCLTYYQRNASFNKHFENGELDKADKILDKDKKAEKRRTRLLHYLNKGVVASMMGNYKLSNEYFEKAYVHIEDQTINLANTAASIVTNDNMLDYNGEEFEKLLIHYYKSLNYLKLNDNEAALVECKRMNIKLNKLQDLYSGKNKYRRDAFMHLLMGLIYDLNKDYNNAFIAYRNAYDVYQEDYSKLFESSVPVQLKHDIMRTAYLSGLFNELDFYEKEFGLKFQNKNNQGGSLLFFWQNGLGPVKEEWAIDLIIVKGQGVVVFQNDDLGLNFTFPMSDKEFNENGFGDLKFVKVAFPRYVERKSAFSSAFLTANNEQYALELVEDVNKIAIKCLQQRMLQVMGKTLLRTAVKQAAEYKLRKKSQEAGAVMSIVNFATEKADTRNWQTLPYSINYVRLDMPEGSQSIKFSAQGHFSMNKEHEFDFNFKKGETIVFSFQTLEYISPNFKP